MFHPGHARPLKQAKEALPRVDPIVGVVNDELINRYKGLTDVREAWRYYRHCRYADEVVRDTPSVLIEEFPIAIEVDSVAHDDLPYELSASRRCS